MKIKAEEIDISFEKITEYLLVKKEKNDKSKFLFALGYSRENWQELLYDIRNIAINNDLILQQINEFGNLFTVKGKLKQKKMITVWLQQITNNNFRFIIS